MMQSIISVGKSSSFAMVFVGICWGIRRIRRSGVCNCASLTSRARTGRYRIETCDIVWNAWKLTQTFRVGGKVVNNKGESVPYHAFVGVDGSATNM